MSDKQKEEGVPTAGKTDGGATKETAKPDAKHYEGKLSRLFAPGLSWADRLLVLADIGLDLGLLWELWRVFKGPIERKTGETLGKKKNIADYYAVKSTLTNAEMLFLDALEARIESEGQKLGQKGWKQNFQLHATLTGPDDPSTKKFLEGLAKKGSVEKAFASLKDTPYLGSPKSSRWQEAKTAAGEIKTAAEKIETRITEDANNAGIPAIGKEFLDRAVARRDAMRAKLQQNQQPTTNRPEDSAGSLNIL